MLSSCYRFLPEKRVTFLTGAGISAESGISTFRNNNGLWENYRFEEVATPPAFNRNPAMVWRFYKYRYNNVIKTIPNAAHIALVELEKKLQQKFTLITQNVDGLHQIAGSNRILEMHGSLLRCRCTKCGSLYKLKDIDISAEIPLCQTDNAYLRPDVVWFGEMPNAMPEIEAVLRQTDFFVVVGTSGVVYPAAQFLTIAKSFGAKTIGINLEKPANMQYIDEFFQGKAGKMLPELIRIWLTR